MSINYVDSLNKDQYEVVRDLEGTCLVIAGAGVGKTHLLTMRAARMLDTGIKPENILTLTFTNKAAKEMKKRICKLVGDIGDRITACTYHSFCASTLRLYANQVGLNSNFNIIDDPETAITKILHDKGYKGKQAKLMLKAKDIYSLITNEIVKGIPISRGIGRDYSNFTSEIHIIQNIADEFKSYKLQKNVADYTDLLVMTRDLLRNHLDIARKMANQFQYIMVDEFQDSNNLQCEILKYLMADVHRNLMVVGDDMQSIYAFTGANYKNILEFPQSFAPCRMNILEQNYRSTQGILNLANVVIAATPYKFEKNLWTEDRNYQKPVLHWTDNSMTEVDSIYNQIAKWKGLGYENRDIAILARTSNELNLLESYFVRDRVPYQKYGGLKFFDKAHVKAVMAFLRIMANYQDELAWLKILPMIPNIGAKTAENIAAEIVQNGYNAMVEKKYQGKKYSDWLNRLCNILLTLTKDVTTGLTDTFGNPGKPQAPLEEQMELMKNRFLNDLFEEAYPEDFEYRLKEYDMFFSLIADYDTATEFLNDILLTGTAAQTDDKDNAITLSTVHSAKGLEWANVIIMDCIEGGFPSMKCTQTNELENVEEERRLLYVAITRAKKNLVLMCPRSYGIYGSYIKGEISRFLEGNPMNYIDVR